MKGKKIASLVCSIVGFIAFSQAQTGVVSGKVVDGKTGETLIGATVAVDDSQNLAVATDLDGNFTISKVPVGKHKVRVRYIGYQEKEEADVTVKPNDVTNLYVSLMEDAVNLNEVAVVANIVKRDNESAIFIMQKNSTVIQSGISSEEMKRSPDRSSGEVIRRVSGSTIQDGKFAIIRGLSDRYNMALLNNTVLPSTEPDRKAFAFDVFPSNILDNIIIMKTGQPNLPSEWAGGIIQLNTRDIPEKNFFNVSYGIGFTEGTTFKNFKTYEGSKTDFLGFDNTVRKTPDNLPGIVPLNDILQWNNKAERDTLVKLGKQINNSSWKTRNQIAYPSQSLQMSGGFAVRKNDVQFGGIFALSYSNNLRITQGSRTRFDASDNSLYYNYADNQYNNSVTSALLGNIGLVIKNNHKISWKNIYTVNSDKTTYQREGISYFSAAEQKRTSLEFVSSRVFSTNLSGEHILGKQEIKWRWQGGATLINRDQPKSMRYSYERFYSSSTPDGFGPNSSTSPFIYQIQSQGGADPKLSAMFYSQLNERVYNAATDLIVPFKIKEQKQYVSVGYSYQNRTRAFSARNLFFNATGSSSDSMYMNPDVDAIINNANFDNGKLTLHQMAFEEDMYSAASQLHSAYVMLENNFTDRFKAVWGFRFESFSQQLTAPTNLTYDVNVKPDGELEFFTRLEDSTYIKSYFSGAYKSDSAGKVKPVFPLLPSINLIYKLNETMNLRASYSQSMSRPEFRECSPFLYYDFVRDANLGGNIDLLQTFIHNADLRYEFFMGKGQAVNVSVFYKHFTNTIELTSIAAGGVPQFVYSNGGEAHLIGAELEVRKNFDFVSKKLEDLTFVANVAYIYSRVNLSNIKNNSGDERKRMMQGQSPYIVNLGLSYEHSKIRTGVTLLYNQVGQRLYAVGEVGNPSWYEHWRPLLDLQVSQRFWKDRGMIRLTVSDLIAKKTIFYQNDKPDSERQYQPGKDNVVQSVNNYRTYSIQLSFKF